MMQCSGKIQLFVVLWYNRYVSTKMCKEQKHHFILLLLLLLPSLQACYTYNMYLYTKLTYSYNQVFFSIHWTYKTNYSKQHIKQLRHQMQKGPKSKLDNFEKFVYSVRLMHALFNSNENESSRMMDKVANTVESRIILDILTMWSCNFHSAPFLVLSFVEQAFDLWCTFGLHGWKAEKICNEKSPIPTQYDNFHWVKIACELNVTCFKLQYFHCCWQVGLCIEIDNFWTKLAA